MTRAIPFVILAAAAGCGRADLSDPFFPAGNGRLVRPNPGILVDPAGRSAWVAHEGELLAISTSSGDITPVYSLDGLEDRRLAFLPGAQALLIASDPGNCPFETRECTRIGRLGTDPPSNDAATAWEGSTVAFATQSPSGARLALSGGFLGNGAFVVDASLMLAPLRWEVLPGGVGWSRCLPDELCTERLWTVGADAIESWPASPRMDGTYSCRAATAPSS